MNLLNTVIGTTIATAVRKQMSDKDLVGVGLGLSALRIATKSVPAALLVSAGLVLTAYYKTKWTAGSGEADY